MTFFRSLSSTCLAAFVLLWSACAKDELTVESTAVPKTCERVTVELDVDSLANCDPGGPGGPWHHHLDVTLCACDTLVLQPVNMPPNADFDHWTIDQGPQDVQFHGFVLDTITVSTELWFNYHQGPMHEHLRVDVDVESCD